MNKEENKQLDTTDFYDMVFSEKELALSKDNTLKKFHLDYLDKLGIKNNERAVFNYFCMFYFSSLLSETKKILTDNADSYIKQSNILEERNKEISENLSSLTTLVKDELSIQLAELKMNLESAEFKNLEKRILENLKIDLNIDSLSDDFKKTIKDYLSKSFTADIRYAIQQEVRSQLSEKGIDDSIIEDIRSETTNEDLKELIESQNKEISTLRNEVKSLKAPVQNTNKQPSNESKDIKNINEKLEKFMYGGVGVLALNVVLLLMVMFKK